MNIQKSILALALVAMAGVPAGALATGVRVESAPCSQAITPMVSQGAVIEHEGAIRILASDLFVHDSLALKAEKGCDVAIVEGGRKVPLELVRYDARAGFALFSLPPSDQVALKAAKTADAVSRKLSAAVVGTDGAAERVALEALQTRSQRSFYPSGRLSIESKMEGGKVAPSALVGAPVSNAKGETVALVSRYHLHFEPGYSARVERVGARDVAYMSPVLIPWREAKAWLDAESEVRARFERLDAKKEYRLSIGMVSFTEGYCHRTRPGQSSPIGGFDGVGIGGIDAAGIGGYDPYTIGGLAHSASVCDISVSVGNRVAEGPAWIMKLRARHADGSNLSVLGARVYDEKAGRWFLVSVYSLDHLFKVMEMPEAEIIVGWSKTTEEKYSRKESRLRSWLWDFSNRFNQQHELSKEHLPTQPKSLHMLNQVRMFTLIIASTTPADLPVKQWTSVMRLKEGDAEYPTFLGLFRNIDQFPFEYLKRFDEIWAQPW